MDEKFFRNADFALENLVDRELPPLNFGGKPGEAVPAVDPDDLKAVWQIGRDVQAGHSGQQDAVAMPFDVNEFLRLCGEETETV